MTLMVLTFASGCGEGDQNVGDSASNSSAQSRHGPGPGSAVEDQPNLIDPHEQVFEDMLRVWERMGDVMTEIDDVKTARDAAIKMRAQFDQFHAVLVRAEQMEPPTKEKAAALQVRYKPLKLAALERYEQELVRVMELRGDLLELANKEMGDVQPYPEVEWTSVD